jgi:tetratricopeptide (TPR) repeat protein
VLARQERWDEAIDHYQRALEIKPDFVAARDNLERILSATRDAAPRDRDLASPRGRPGS